MIQIEDDVVVLDLITNDNRDERNMKIFKN